MNKKAVALASGGLDSTVSMAWAASQGCDLYAISFDYGQRHRIELEAARRVCKAAGAKRHLVLRVDLEAIGGSALTDDIPVPKGRDEAAMAANIPVTYVPARNIVFLSIALGWAETLEADLIVIGANAIDYSGYPDCRPEFLRAFEAAARLGVKDGPGGVWRPAIAAPLIDKTKADIVRLGAELGVDFSLTHSCYSPEESGAACGACDSCLLRLKGFREAGLEDPAPYRQAR